MLGKYRIVRPLGSGGMAAVYEALHTGIGKPVAIKTLRAVATDARAEARFLREAAAASRLDHPHVVDVTDFGTENGLSYLVMELLRGEDMGAVVARDPGTLDPTFVVDVMLAVCAGVFAAHESGVIHRDLKPQNIFLARTPLGELVPKVLDFGISKRIDEDVGSGLTNSGARAGHDPLPVARADRRQAAGRSQRPVRPGRDPLRGAHRPPAARGQHRLRGHAQHRRGELRAAAQGPPRHPRGARGGDRAGHERQAAGPVRIGARAGPGAPADGLLQAAGHLVGLLRAGSPAGQPLGAPQLPRSAAATGVGREGHDGDRRLSRRSRRRHPDPIGARAAAARAHPDGVARSPCRRPPSPARRRPRPPGARPRRGDRSRAPTEACAARW